MTAGHNFGWIDDGKEVEKVLSTLPMPLVQGNTPRIRGTKPVLLATFYRKVVGRDAPKGPQGIGDCVGWGYSNLVNHIAALQCYKVLSQKNLLTLTPEDHPLKHTVRATVVEIYEDVASEVIYALSRVEIGGQRGSMQDGSVGAWAAKAIATYGTLSRKELQRRGLSPDYDKNRAKQWGAQGLPDALEPAAKQHTVKNVSRVDTFDQAAALIENGYGIAVCSSQGFTMTRDRQGFCLPRGRWDHCMFLGGVRYDREGLLCYQNWGPNAPNGPLALEQPDNTFWVDRKVVNDMLARRDSFTGTAFDGYYEQEEFNGDWSH